MEILPSGYNPSAYSINEEQLHFKNTLSYLDTDYDGKSTTKTYTLKISTHKVNVFTSLDPSDKKMYIALKDASLIVAKARAMFDHELRHSNVRVEHISLDLAHFAEVLRINDITSARYDHLHKALNITVPDDDRNLYLPSDHRLALLLLQWLSEKIAELYQVQQVIYPPFLNSESTVTNAQHNSSLQSYITSFYINSILALSSGDVASQMLFNIKEILSSNQYIILLDDTYPEIDAIGKKFTYFDSWDIKKLTEVAFFGLCGISKRQTKFEFVKDWIEKRVSALYNSCKLGAPYQQYVPLLQFDISLPSD